MNFSKNFTLFQFEQIIDYAINKSLGQRASKVTVDRALRTQKMEIKLLRELPKKIKLVKDVDNKFYIKN